MYLAREKAISPSTSKSYCERLARFLLDLQEGEGGRKGGTLVVVGSREAARRYVEGRWVRACGIAAKAKRAKLCAWKHFVGFLGLTLGGRREEGEEEGETGRAAGRAKRERAAVGVSLCVEE